MKRREFIGKTAIAAAGISMMPAMQACAANDYPFQLCLDPGAIGVKGDQLEVIELASAYGYGAVSPNAGYIAGLDEAGIAELLELLEDKGLVWGAAGLPFNFRDEPTAHQEGIEKLAAMGSNLQKAGVTRMGTWIYPAHDTLTYRENFQLHADRIRQICEVLQPYGIRFGLEYVGPKTAVISRRFPFMHSMKETKELIAEIDMPNAGFVLDTYHWYNAEEDKAEILTLSNEEIVSCDLNDAPAGRELHEQMDLERELPAATGVVDVKSFLEALIEIGYDGPIRAEPFSKPLREMENEPATETTIQALKQAVGQLG